MPSLVVSILGGLSVLFGMVLLALGVAQLRFVLRLRGTEPTPVREVPSVTGPVEIVGAATPDTEMLVAPVSGEDCLAYDYEILEEEYGLESHEWRTLDSGTATVPFLVDDGTSVVLVNPDGADLSFETETTRTGRKDDPPPGIERALDSPEESSETPDLRGVNFNGVSDHEFREGRLDPAEDVYVYGTPERTVAGEYQPGRVDAVLRAGDTESMFAPVFVVADGRKHEVIGRLLWRSISGIGLGLLWMAGTVLVVLWLG